MAPLRRLNKKPYAVAFGVCVIAALAVALCLMSLCDAVALPPLVWRAVIDGKALYRTDIGEANIDWMDFLTDYPESPSAMNVWRRRPVSPMIQRVAGTFVTIEVYADYRATGQTVRGRDNVVWSEFAKIVDSVNQDR